MVSCILTPVGSNYTFLAKLRDEDGREMRAIYKPMKGEIPLWDFESGTLYKRECAAYLFSQMLGWEFVPETVIREGPYGTGSMQRFVEHEPGVTYRELRESHRGELKKIACFDIIANNADRKAVHCIKGLDGRVWGIDHGLTFNAAFTLRTVIWDFWGEELEGGDGGGDGGVFGADVGAAGYGEGVGGVASTRGGGGVGAEDGVVGGDGGVSGDASVLECGAGFA